VGISSRIARLRNRLESEGVHLLKDVNAVFDVNVGGRHMPERKLTKDELERQQGEQLPDREVMTALHPPIQPLPPVYGDGDLYPTEPIHPDTTGGTT
jgi:hypothetical protein